MYKYQKKKMDCECSFGNDNDSSFESLTSFRKKRTYNSFKQKTLDDSGISYIKTNSFDLRDQKDIHLFTDDSAHTLHKSFHNESSNNFFEYFKKLKRLVCGCSKK